METCNYCNMNVERACTSQPYASGCTYYNGTRGGSGRADLGVVTDPVTGLKVSVERLPDPAEQLIASMRASGLGARKGAARGLEGLEAAGLTVITIDDVFPPSPTEAATRIRDLTHDLEMEKSRNDDLQRDYDEANKHRGEALDFAERWKADCLSAWARIEALQKACSERDKTIETLQTAIRQRDRDVQYERDLLAPLYAERDARMKQRT